MAPQPQAARRKPAAVSRARCGASIFPPRLGSVDSRLLCWFDTGEEGRGPSAIEFRRDSYICSFGNDQIFVEENGADGSAYLDWLAARIQQFPEGHVHAWQGDAIVGQIEMIIGSRGGYINLFYLRPESRGQGLGGELHAYAVALLRRYRVTVAGLSVSPTNEPAVRYYQRHGWLDRGPRPGAPHVHEMELAISYSGD
jgi:GNAT superfamily N-acetyltransferase